MAQDDRNIMDRVGKFELTNTHNNLLLITSFCEKCLWRARSMAFAIYETHNLHPNPKGGLIAVPLIHPTLVMHSWKPFAIHDTLMYVHRPGPNGQLGILLIHPALVLHNKKSLYSEELYPCSGETVVLYTRGFYGI